MYHDTIIENNSMPSIVDHNGIENSGAHTEKNHIIYAIASMSL
jgi:hypothetical protein